MKENTHEISFEIASPPEGVKKTIEQWMAEDGVETIYVEGLDGVETIYVEGQDGGLHPIARMKRHPDCPRPIYEAWKRTLFEI